MKSKFIKKYMAIAKAVGTIENPCFSRQIGSVIVSKDLSRILGTGYNGPPRGVPHTDTEEYIREYLWPQLSVADKIKLVDLDEMYPDDSDEALQNTVAKKYAGCGQCPRRLLGIPSGQRNELCNCLHSERNAITNASQTLTDAIIFCWCGVPCIQCTGTIINSGIQSVYCLYQRPLYHEQSPWLLHKAGVNLIEILEEELEL